MKTTQKNAIALFAIILTIGTLMFTNKASVPRGASWEDVVSEAESGNYKLITTDEFWKLFSYPDNNVLIVDTRQEWEYRTGHIKGALNFPMEPTWLSRWRKQSFLEKF